MIIQRKGSYYVLTNRHVIRDAPAEASGSIWPTAGDFIRSEVWADAETDVAVMAVSAADLVATLGDSDRMEIGDFVLAVGSPFGLSHSVTFGIISAQGRRDLDLGDDVGPLSGLPADRRGHQSRQQRRPLVQPPRRGDRHQHGHRQQLGRQRGDRLLHPHQMFMIVARQLIDTGKVTRAFLGVSLDAKFGPAMAAELGMPRATGTRVTRHARRPAEAAGIRAGDVILKIDGTAIDDDAQLMNLVGLIEVGKKVSLEIFATARRSSFRWKSPTAASSAREFPCLLCSRGTTQSDRCIKPRVAAGRTGRRHPGR